MRGHHRETLTISLFPFLSILACVIGTLTLLISGLIVGEIAPAALAESGRGSVSDDLAHPSGPEQAPAGDPLGDAQGDARGGVDAPAGRDAPGDAQSLGGDRAVGGERIEDVSERDGRARAPASDEPLGEGPLTPRLQGSGLELPLVIDYFDPADARRYLPGFVLCDREGVVLDVQESLGPRERVGASELGSSPELLDYLRRVGGSSKGIVVFLIEPGGVPAFERASELARSERLRFGQLPVPDGRPLDFTRLEQRQRGEALPGGEEAPR